MSEERWLPVPGWEQFYEVSDLGRVRSLDHMVWTRGHKSMCLRRGRLLKPSPASRGYPTVTLCVNGTASTVTVHHLVLTAFVGPCPPGHEACHGPGGRQDNRLVNLSWGTKSKNNGEDKRRDGTAQRGTRHGMAKLTEEIVLECRVRYAAGENTVALAKEFGVTPSAMWLAVIGRTWRHIPMADS